MKFLTQRNQKEILLSICELKEIINKEIHDIDKIDKATKLLVEIVCEIYTTNDLEKLLNDFEEYKRR